MPPPVSGIRTSGAPAENCRLWETFFRRPKIGTITPRENHDGSPSSPNRGIQENFAAGGRAPTRAGTSYGLTSFEHYWEMTSMKNEHYLKRAAISCAAASVAVALQASAQTPAVEGSEPLLPPNAKPGECYTRIYVPPTYEEIAEEVLIKDASEVLDIIPAEYETVEEKIQVKQESEMIEVIPATFKTVEEKVMVKPETEEVEVVPAEYETVEEKVLVREAYTTWKTGRGPIEKIDATTGEIMCLVEVPAEYKTVQKQVLKSPPTTRIVNKPAEFEVVETLVIDQPAQTRIVTVPAEFTTVKVTRLKTEAKEVRTPVAEERDTVTRTVKKTDGRVEWRPILCQTNTTPGVVKRIQQALKDAGFYNGPVDGGLGPMTMRAVKAYQSENNMAAGQLTLETLEALNVGL